MTINNNNPIDAARQLHYELGWTSPSDFTLEEIAGCLNIIVRNVPIKGSEGRILINGSTAIISINESVTHSGKRNFILAHEIGHFILHRNITTLFSETDNTLAEWFKKGLHEQQANVFASEFLMPEFLYRKKIEGKKLNMALIEDVSAFFKTSLLTTFFRYIQLGSFPAMIIFMEAGVVRWKIHSHDFPFTYLPLNSEVPAWTVAGDFFNRGQLEIAPERVDAIEWFPEDFQIKYKKDWKLWEQCYQIGQNSLVSCLWTY